MKGKMKMAKNTKKKTVETAENSEVIISKDVEKESPVETVEKVDKTTEDVVEKTALEETSTEQVESEVEKTEEAKVEEVKTDSENTKEEKLKDVDVLEAFTSEELEYNSDDSEDRFEPSIHLRILISFIVLLFGFAIGFTVGWLAF